MRELEQAKRSIHLSVYQFHNLYLMDQLNNASLRGVDVNVLLDGSPVGGLTDLGRFVAAKLTENGVEVRFIRSSTKENIHRRYNYLHTKYAVIDNITTIVMSENWKLSGVPMDNTIGNRGWGIVLRHADIARDFYRVFYSDWNSEMKDIIPYSTSNSKYGSPPDDFLPSWTVYGGNYIPRFSSQTFNGEFRVTPVISPDTTMNWYSSVLEMLNSAERTIYVEQLSCYIDWDTKGRIIENQYLEALFSAAKRGCEVKLLLDSAFVQPDNPGLDNYDTVNYINNRAAAEGLEHRLEARLIHLTGTDGGNELSLLHNKGVIVDDTKTLISSINWATGSVIHNREAGVIVENKEVARFFTEIFNYDWNLTVQERIKCYVLHSDTHDIKPGQSTKYIISILNIQTEETDVTLSLFGLKPGWMAELNITVLKLPPYKEGITKPYEITLTVQSPTKEFISKYLNNSTNNDLQSGIDTLPLGLRIETHNMSCEIVFTTTNVILDSSMDPDDNIDHGGSSDRSMLDPWLVVVLLAVLIIAGAVVRDAVQVKMNLFLNKSGNSGEKTVFESELEE
jgi:phosphatidylserine/phosphatidylglycerophosphate/cardiolipin synthase-like enzyme